MEGKQVVEGRVPGRRLVGVARPVTIAGGEHPSGEDGWCSCCRGEARHGVKLSGPSKDKFFFVCVDCATRIGEAAAR